jgi:hypothetical protein
VTYSKLPSIGHSLGAGVTGTTTEELEEDATFGSGGVFNAISVEMTGGAGGGGGGVSAMGFDS